MVAVLSEPQWAIVLIVEDNEAILREISFAMRTSGFDVLFRNVRTEGISSTDLYRLGWAALQIEPGSVRNYTVPATVGQRGAQSVVFIRQPAASSVFVDFADDGVLQAH